jgi:L-2-hydroxyglutarate oxidase LhgO
LLDSQETFGQGTSSRNSEVIHAGLYYPQNSLKAKLCIEGRRQLYEYCADRHIPHQKIGKWIVANSSAQSVDLERIYLQAINNGCSEVHYLRDREIKSQEPELNCVAALSSPETGIIDSHALMFALLADFENNGGKAIFNTTVNKLKCNGGKIELLIEGSADSSIEVDYLINAAGLRAVSLLSHFEGFPKQEIPQFCYAKGNYFSLQGKSPFGRLIYPVPEVGGLGIHFTLDLNGVGKFGPDVEWITDESYEVNAERNQLFFDVIKSYWPRVSMERLQPAYAGIRPKLGSKDNLYKDFLIQTNRDHQINGLVNLLGIESPGLTSCLSLADYVVGSLGIG